MKRLMLVTFAALAVVLLPLRAAAQQPMHADSPKVTISVSEDLTVGTTVLKPGDYRFQCKTFDGKTFLIISSVETGKEITRVACVREMLDGKVTDSQYRALRDASGKRVLTHVRIKGETAEHKIVVN